MTQEEKQLLLIDLSARLPYGVIIDAGPQIRVLNGEDFDFYSECNNPVCTPYLRPMSSMTEEEKKTYIEIGSHLCGEIVAKTMIDWLNKKHFDYRGLIEKGLALEAPADMYKTE